MSNCEEEIIFEQSETSSIINDDDDDDDHVSSRNEEKYQQNISLPSDAVAPSCIDAIPSVNRKQIEDDLFQHIEQLVREFVIRTNRQFPYYRVMRWTTHDDQQSKIEQFVTVLINQSPIHIVS